MQQATATLDIDPVRAQTAFRHYAQSADRPVTEKRDGLQITLHRGALTVLPDGASTVLQVESPDRVGLQIIRDLLAERLAGLGLRPDWQEDLTGQQPGNQSLAQVLSVSRLSPAYSRVEIEGPDLARFAQDGLHFRLLLGPEGADWPMTDAQGVTDWPGGMSAWHRPVYTTRAIALDGEAARLTFDVFRHEGGRVTDWCDRLAPGAEIALTGPGGGGLPKPKGWIGLVADETGLPVMARVLEAMPATTTGEVVLFVPDPADRQDLPRPPGVTLTWVHDRTQTPLDALKALRFPATDRYVFFAGEKAQAVEARSWLPAQGFARGEFICAAYWSRDI